MRILTQNYSDHVAENFGYNALEIELCVGAGIAANKDIGSTWLNCASFVAGFNVIVMIAFLQQKACLTGEMIISDL
jgi:hypothetical protein